ncbi:MAG: aspartate/glutamate racemase family protein [Bellilinea sp.]|jgi:allantoin racemase
MRILVINPNTSQSFTDLIDDVLEQYREPETIVAARNPTSGPRSIESVYDELLSAQGTLQLFLSEIGNHDGFILACYSDHPAIYAMRELTKKPVIGIAEASMLMACMVGHKFSVVTTNDAWQPLLWEAVRHYGLENRCASIRATGLAVLDLGNHEGQDNYNLIRDAAQSALGDGAEVICLGCAGMAGLDKRLEEELGVPVIDGVVSALKFMEGLLKYGLRTSKRRAYTQPMFKALDNLPPEFGLPYKKL